MSGGDVQESHRVLIQIIHDTESWSPKKYYAFGSATIQSLQARLG
jgi:hypothetical protein